MGSFSQPFRCDCRLRVAVIDFDGGVSYRCVLGLCVYGCVKRGGGQGIEIEIERDRDAEGGRERKRQTDRQTERHRARDRGDRAAERERKSCLLYTSPSPRDRG